MIKLIKNDVAFIKVRTRNKSIVGLDLSIWFDEGGHGRVKPYYFIRQTVAQDIFFGTHENEVKEHEIYDDSSDVFQTLSEAETYIKDAIAANSWNDEPLVF